MVLQNNYSCDIQLYIYQELKLVIIDVNDVPYRNRCIITAVGNGVSDERSNRLESLYYCDCIHFLHFWLLFDC